MKTSRNVAPVRRCRRSWIAGLILATSWLGCPLMAEPIVRDLGNGLVFFRAANAPADLPSEAAVQKRTVVLDLRYARADQGGGNGLAEWLKFHTLSGQPVFVLANQATAADLLQVLATHRGTRPLLTVGIAGPGFQPDIAVNQSLTDEKAAFDALAEGASTSALTTDNPRKQRNDEASLSRDRPLDSEPPEEPPANDGKAAPASKSRPPQIDAALQRAMHLHLGLKALKKS